MKREIIRHRRLDLINSMKHGDQKRIADLLNTKPSIVSATLNGHRNQNSDQGRNIIRLAERFAERSVMRQAVRNYRSKKAVR